MKKLAGYDSSLIAFAFPMPRIQSRRCYLSGGDATKLVAAFAEGDVELVLGGTVGDLPYALSC